jgi:hypothetical protein
MNESLVLLLFKFCKYMSWAIKIIKTNQIGKKYRDCPGFFTRTSYIKSSSDLNFSHYKTSEVLIKLWYAICYLSKKLFNLKSEHSLTKIKQNFNLVLIKFRIIQFWFFHLIVELTFLFLDLQSFFYNMKINYPLNFNIALFLAILIVIYLRCRIDQIQNSYFFHVYFLNSRFEFI